MILHTLSSLICWIDAEELVKDSDILKGNSHKTKMTQCSRVTTHCRDYTSTTDNTDSDHDINSTYLTMKMIKKDQIHNKV